MTTLDCSDRLTRRRLVGGVTGAGLAGLLAYRDASALASTAEAPMPTAEGPRVVDRITIGTVDGQPLEMTAYLPAPSDSPRPAILAIHGGGLIDIGGDMAPAALRLADHGHVVFVIAYRLMDMPTKTNLWPAQIDDVQRAVRWIRAHAAEYQVDPDRVGAYGRSSGGFLASLLGVVETRDNRDSELSSFSSRVTCVAELAGESDLSIPYDDPTWTRVNEVLLGGTIEQVPEVYREASPIAHVDENTVPFFIFQATDDTEVPVEHGRRLLDALTAARREVVYVEVPGISHLSLASWELTGPFLLAFFDRHLRPDR